MLGYEAILEKMLGHETKYKFCPNISNDLIWCVSNWYEHIEPEMTSKHETTESVFNFWCLYINFSVTIVTLRLSFKAVLRLWHIQANLNFRCKHKSPVHQYEQIKFNRSHNTNSASLQKLSFLCNILDLVNCVLWESSVLMLFSTCITERFVISTKAPGSVIQPYNLMAMYYQ